MPLRVRKELWSKEAEGLLYDPDYDIQRQTDSWLLAQEDRWVIGSWGGKKLQVTMMVVTIARLLRTSPLVNCDLWRKLCMQIQPLFSAVTLKLL